MTVRTPLTHKPLTHLILSTAIAVGAASALALPTAAVAEPAPGISQAEAPARSPVAKALEDRLHGKSFGAKTQKEFSPAVLEAVRRAYAQRNYAPLWTPQSAAAFREEARTLRDHGIVAEDVFTAKLDKRVDALGAGSPKARAKADLNLTLAAARAARALSAGLGDEGETVTDGVAPQSGLVDYLQRAGEGERGLLADYAPTHPQYAKLQTALADYKALARTGGWSRLPDGDLIEPGDTDPRVSALRTRLRAEGFDVPDSPTPDLYDADVEAAVKDFQSRHGLEQDGLVGGNTLEALNESVHSKVARISDTLHRWRRHGDMGERFVLANIPSYTAQGWNGGVKEIEMRTVVGKPQHATPVFSDTVEYVVANPKWYVPVSIARRQKLSKLRRNAAYAPRNGYQVVSRETGQAVSAASVNWNDPDVLSRYRLVQQPGDNNALGEMKIIFPNQYSVYLHGTPTTHLFDEAQRAFSSGCVRLEDPEAMARWIAKYDEGFTPGEVSDQLDSGERERMYLDGGMPVHITYFTVTADERGPVFHRDVYDRLDDVKAAKKLASLD